MTEIEPTPNASAARLSGTAALSAVLAMVSLAACVTAAAAALLGFPAALAAIVVLPVLGLTAAVLGFTSLSIVRRSGGRVIGRVPALIGLFLGLTSAIIQGAFALSVLRVYFDLRNAAAPAVSRMVYAADRGDLSGLRATLSEKASADLTDARAAEFGAALRREAGTIAGAEVRLGTLIRTFEAGRRAARSGSVQPLAEGVLPKPVEIVGDRATLLAYVIVDQDALKKEQVKVADLLVVLPDGRGLTLMNDGPASSAAESLNLKIER
ncbi:MAG: hypothetical protein IBJ11_03370 [Phycisphaerales bacterium]|nr:hypothetical protein [Phycisphaerales bacterium]